VAHYWTGGYPTPRQVVDISQSGAAILAPDVYYPGTVIRIALEDVVSVDSPAGVTAYAGVWGRVLRRSDDGFSVQFVFENQAERRYFCEFLGGLRRRSLDETNGKRTEGTIRTVVG